MCPYDECLLALRVDLVSDRAGCCGLIALSFCLSVLSVYICFVILYMLDGSIVIA